MAFQSVESGWLTRELPEVLVAGELFIDLVMSGLNEFPQLGREVFAHNFTREAGGGAAITACGLAKLGMRSGVFGVVGAEDGHWLIGRLREQNLDASQIQLHASEPTAFTVVASTRDDRAFLSYEGANRFFESRLVQALESRRPLSERHVHLAYAPSPEIAAGLFARIHETGCTVSLDVGWREKWLDHPNALDILRIVDIFFPNLSEAIRLTGETSPSEILHWFREEGIKKVALKLGSQGAALLWDGQNIFAKPIAVAPIDTTGAGDSFNAGFIRAWLTGETPSMCLQQANICGALSTEACGGVAGFPTPERLKEELLRSNHA